MCIKKTKLSVTKSYICTVAMFHKCEKCDVSVMKRFEDSQDAIPLKKHIPLKLYKPVTSI